jgi:polypeptide N-acetylgalactosaminyltransferase
LTGGSKSDGAGSSSSNSKDGAADKVKAREVSNFVPKNPDADHLHGMVGVDDKGVPLFSVKPMPPDETAEEKREHHKGNCFNLARSDSLPLDRPIPDVRSEQCKQMTYPHDLPDTSIVFVFFNEPASPLYRSVHSVLNRSPPHLIREIILVDDGSDVEWLQKPLEDYIATLPKVKLVRTHARTGLMRARTIGAENAIGDTVTFLDSHIECNHGWLEPLLYRVHQDRRHVVMPVIDSIHPDGFSYNQGGLDILGFSWGLGQKGIGQRKRSQLEPMPSPISECENCLHFFLLLLLLLLRQSSTNKLSLISRPMPFVIPLFLICTRFGSFLFYFFWILK